MGVATLRHEEQGVASNDFHEGGGAACFVVCVVKFAVALVLG